MKKLQVKNFGTKVQGIELLGDPRSLEPDTIRISFPWGDVDVTRAADDIKPDYWVHIRVNRPDDGDSPDREFGRVVDGRADILGKHTSDVDPAWLADPNTYHVAVRVGPA